MIITCYFTLRGIYIWIRHVKSTIILCICVCVCKKTIIFDADELNLLYP